jgi:nitroreductase
MNDVVELLKSHRSIRKFTDQPVSESTLQTILECAQSASTSNFVQAYSFIHVTDVSVRKEIREVAGGQEWVETAPVFLVFCADLTRLTKAAEINGVTPHLGYTEQFLISTVDAALAAQNAMVAAESMGLGGVYIGAIRNDPSRVAGLLEIPETVYPVFGMCLGYPAQDPEKKPRFPLAVVLKHETYSNTGDTDKIRAYDETVNAYYRSRSESGRDENWSKQMATLMSSKLRPHMREFLAQQGFEMK